MGLKVKDHVGQLREFSAASHDVAQRLLEAAQKMQGFEEILRIAEDVTFVAARADFLRDLSVIGELGWVWRVVVLQVVPV